MPKPTTWIMLFVIFVAHVWIQFEWGVLFPIPFFFVRINVLRMMTVVNSLVQVAVGYQAISIIAKRPATYSWGALGWIVGFVLIIIVDLATIALGLILRGIL